MKLMWKSYELKLTFYLNNPPKFLSISFWTWRNVPESEHSSKTSFICEEINVILHYCTAKSANSIILHWGSIIVHFHRQRILDNLFKITQNLRQHPEFLISPTVYLFSLLWNFEYAKQKESENMLWNNPASAVVVE